MDMNSFHSSLSFCTIIHRHQQIISLSIHSLLTLQKLEFYLSLPFRFTQSCISYFSSIYLSPLLALQLILRHRKSRL